jgi:hypothetical protein
MHNSTEIRSCLRRALRKQQLSGGRARSCGHPPGACLGRARVQQPLGVVLPTHPVFSGAISVRNPGVAGKFRTRVQCFCDFVNLLQHEQPAGESSVEVKLLSCLNRGVAEHALLATDWVDCGASCNHHEIVQVFELRGSHPFLIQQIDFDSDATGTGATFDGNSLTLTVRGRSKEDSPHCCPKSLDVVTYRWERQKFVQSSYKRAPVPSS